MLKSEFINAENKTHIVLSTKGIWTSCFEYLNYITLQEWEARRRRNFIKRPYSSVALVETLLNV